jgi:hypothetical protein
MRRLKFFSVVGAAALLGAALAGCEGGDRSTGPAPIVFTPPPPAAGTGFVALYAPPVDVVPYPNDLYNPTGAKLAVPAKVTTPLANALNTLDGFSTTAVITAPFNAPVEPASLIPFDPNQPALAATASVFVVNATLGVPLVPGTDYTVRVSSAAGAESLVEIVPLKPLRPRTRYAFWINDKVRSVAGAAAAADTVFGAVRDAHLAGRTSVPGAPQLAPLFPVIGPLISGATSLLGIPGNTVVAAWTMQTQSISEVLELLDQTSTPRNSLLASAGITTAQLGQGLPGLASIFVGWIEVPYYGDPANPLASFWVNAQLQPPTGASPAPVARVPAKRIPLLATLPSASTGLQQPPAGWPVVIFQHGITLNRTVMLAIADAFAQAGFAMVAIDLPLHGVTDTASPFYQGPSSAFGNNERHFNLDNVGATGVFAPDGQIDNGWQILNVGNPLNARDHIRQAVADSIALARTIPALDFPDGDANPDLDGANIHYVGISLGSIISGVFLGVNTDVTTATLSSPAGPWTSILTDADAVDFGAPIRAVLSAQGLPPGTIGFNDFVRDLQTVIDPVDPINYAADAAANHPLHVIEVLGDTAVPNRPTDYLASLWGLPSVHATTTVALPTTTSGIVRFVGAGHSSLFNPAINAAVTAEMQSETVVFAASRGSALQVTNASVVQ